ncbi:MAG: hypothetical protein IKH70_05175, partial [Stomatobaculum sp.]|nr:hypothetical protein [Stomatobaculum sp.]
RNDINASLRLGRDKNILSWRFYIIKLYSRQHRSFSIICAISVIISFLYFARTNEKQLPHAYLRRRFLHLPLTNSLKCSSPAGGTL